MSAKAPATTTAMRRWPAPALGLLLCACALGPQRQALPSPWDWPDQPVTYDATDVPRASEPLPVVEVPQTAAPSRRAPYQLVVPRRPDQPVIYGVTPAHPYDPLSASSQPAPPAAPQAAPASLQPAHALPPPTPVADAPASVSVPRAPPAPMRAPDALRTGPADPATAAAEALPGSAPESADPFPPPRRSQRPAKARVDPYSTHLWRRPGTRPRGGALPAAPLLAPAPGDRPAVRDGPAPAATSAGEPVQVAAIAAPAPHWDPGPVSGHFVLGPGDVITITVYGQPDLTTTAHVSDRGKVLVPLAGEVAVSGLSPTDAARRIAQAYAEQQILVDPQVNVTVAEYRSQQVSVIGEVRNPGRFAVEGPLTVLDAIALAGGTTELAGSRVQVLRRAGGQVHSHIVDLAELADGRPRQPFPLRAGDTLVVPKAEMFYIYGEVRQPAAYRLEPGMTVVQALSVSGGLTERGSDRRIEIQRRGPDGRLRTIPAALDTVLEPDDVVHVRERIF